jgi:hypothetical protein
MDTHVHNQTDSRVTQPWNKGKLTGAKLPLLNGSVDRISRNKIPVYQSQLTPRQRQKSFLRSPCPLLLVGHIQAPTSGFQSWP